MGQCHLDEVGYLAPFAEDLLLREPFRQIWQAEEVELRHSACTQGPGEAQQSFQSSIADPEWFIPDPDPDPDPALNFPSFGSGSKQKFQIHADPGRIQSKLFFI